MPVDYATGELQLSANDLSAGGFGQGWGHTRTYSNRMTSNVNYGNGYNWLVDQWPSIVSDSTETVVVQSGLDSFWFDGVGVGPFAGQLGILATLEHDDDAGQYVLALPGGTVERFNDLATAPAPGALVSQTSRGGATITLSYNHSSQLVEAQRSAVVGGSTLVESFVYAYVATGPSAGNLASVTLRRGPSSTGPWTNVRQVQYAYHDGSTSFGLAGDLSLATQQTFDGASWRELGASYYRYYTSSTATGFAHGLKYDLGPAAYQALLAAGGDPLLAPDSLLAHYADHYFEYEPITRRVTKEVAAGGTQAYTFAYLGSTNFGPNEWRQKTVETRPDGSRHTVYSNDGGQTLLKQLQQPATGDEWITYYQFDDSYNIVQTATPSAVVSFDDSAGHLSVVLRPASGLIQQFVYGDDTPGQPAGYLVRTQVQEGASGSPVTLTDSEYLANTADDGTTVFLLAQRTQYQDEAEGSPSTTQFDYTFYPGTNQPLERVTTLPAVDVSQNGSGESAVGRVQYDQLGNMIWEQGPRGFVDQFTYDIVTGAVIQRVQDVDPDVLTLPSDWMRPTTLAPALNLVTDYELDEQGRVIQTLGPSHLIGGIATRRAQCTVYNDGNFQTWTAQGYATGSGPGYAFTLVNPVSITATDDNGRPTDTIEAALDSTAWPPAADAVPPQTSWTRWTRQLYNDAGQLVARCVYHTIPASGLGSGGANYDETVYGYDSCGRQNRTVSPAGTITRQTLDARGRTVGTWIGTNDTGATDADPTGGSASGNNMVITSSFVYESTCDCSQPTTLTQYVDSDPANNRVTQYTLDYRNRVVEVQDALATSGSPLGSITQMTYDNLDRKLQLDRLLASSGQLLARSQQRYDNRSQAFQQIVYSVDPATGEVGNSLVSNTWRDEAGNVIKSLPAGSQQFTKTMYDSQARPYAEYQGYDTGADAEAYSDVGQITSTNKIFEQTIKTFDADQRSPIEIDTYLRNHNADETGGPLSATAAATQPWSRTSYVAKYYDGLDRLVATADYGTNGDAAFTRPADIPARSDDVLVTTYAFDEAGNRNQTVDPAGVISLQRFDARGKTISAVSNYTSGAPGNSADVSVNFTYTPDAKLATLTAVNPSTGDQTTTYSYGVTPSGSALASNELLGSTTYPDGHSVVNNYNRQKELVERTDQNGTLHQYLYDALGRQTDDVAVTLGSGIDSAVRRMQRSYDAMGLLHQVTSYSDVAGTSAANQVANVYNGFQQLVTQYQEHAGAVDTAMSLSVGYSYDGGIANTVRLIGMTYPNGRMIAYAYVTDDGYALSRVTSVSDLGEANGVAYTYLGLGTFVQGSYPEPDIAWNPATGSDANPYAGFDRFGRVIDCLWQGPSSAVEDVQYGYDRAGSRIWRHNTAAPTDSGNDELYDYDNLQRLVAMQRGTLDGSHEAIMEQTFAQTWNLDATGNWTEFTNTDSLATSNSFNQTRTGNPANEITAIVQLDGDDWAQPAYDRAGNMIVMPQASAPGSPVTGTYDAWNRLASLAGVATYAYDGLKRRITTTSGGSTRHYYHTARWQNIEERLDASATPDRQLVWGLRYLDDLVLRDRSVFGVLDERLYALQDANWNVTAVTDAGGRIQERYRYAPYGLPTVVDASFDIPSDDASSYDWKTGYAGYEWDGQSGKYQARYRELLALLGCWSSRDQLGYADGTHLYLYVGASPVTATDALGLLRGAPEAWVAEEVVLRGAGAVFLPIAAAYAVLFGDPTELGRGSEIKVSVDDICDGRTKTCTCVCSVPDDTGRIGYIFIPNVDIRTCPRYDQTEDGRNRGVTVCFCKG
jgi:RHS repeat-associated protein